MIRFAAIAVLSFAVCAITAHAGDDIRHRFFVAGPNLTGIIGEDGSVEWDAGRKGARDGFVLPNGNVLVAWSNEIKEFTPDKKVVFHHKKSAENKEIGTVQRLANGRTLVTELGEKPRLMELGADGAVAVEFPLEPETKNAHMQTRMARKLANGNYLVPHLLAFAVKEYTPAGEVVKTYHTDKLGQGDRKVHNWPFTAIRVPGGNTVIGCTHGNRVVEVDPSGKPVWVLTNDDVGGIIKDACGVQRLANGNTVVASYAAKKGVKLFEVSPDKKVVWSYSGPNRVYHFQVLTTNGVPEPAPALK